MVGRYPWVEQIEFASLRKSGVDKVRGKGRRRTRIPNYVRMMTLYVLDTLVLASDYLADNSQKTSKHLPRNWHGNSPRGP